jgi:hypothetical protein
MGRIAR